MPLDPTIADEAAALYFGEVMHARLKPMGHRFSYRVMSLLIDLDRLEDADRLSPLFAVNRAALYSFHESDHGARDGSSLRAYAQASRRRAWHRSHRRPRAAALLSPPARLHLQSAVGLFLLSRRRQRSRSSSTRSATPSAKSTPTCCRCAPARLSAAGVRQQQDKLFYVSPFVDMAMRYRFRISPPGEQVKLRILETDREGPLLAATFIGRHRRLTTRGAAPRLRRAAAGDGEDRRRDPLGGAAALAQGREAGRPSRFRNCERQYRLGEPAKAALIFHER